MKLWHETVGHGVPLLLIHGWGMNATVWEPWLEHLRGQFAVTRVELPGHGNSAMSGELASLADWAQAVARVAPDNAIWLGWSLGGSVALQAAIDQLKTIRALYLMTATPCFAQRESWHCAMGQATLQQFADNLESDIDGTLMRFLSLQIKGTEQSRELLKQLRAGFASHPHATVKALKTGLAFLRDTDLRQELAQLEIPMHWTFGERDTLVPACASDAVSQLVGRASVQTIRGAGHVPFLSHAGQCLQSLQELVTRLQT